MLWEIPRPQRRLIGRKPPESDGGDEKQGDPSAEAAGRTRLSVLVVDDVADTRDLYQRFFQFQGARVITAADGVAALQAALFEHPDAIVLDLAMPGMTGWEVIASLKRNPRTRAIPIVVLSGQGARDSALKAGADSYREKPCLPDELLAEILRMLRQPRRGH
jgi:two-component system, cell cycle response regulator DivK